MQSPDANDNGVELANGDDAAIALFGEGYVAPVDDLSGILDSDLMVEAQIGSVQTYIGTRVHFRLSLVFAGSAGARRGNFPLNQRAWCKISDGGAFFPAANAGARPVNPIAPGNRQVFAREPRPDPVAGNPPPLPHTGVNVPAFVRDDIKTFMMAEGVNGMVEQMPFAMFTSEMEADMRNDFKKLRDLVDHTGRDCDEWITDEFKIIGVEIPLVDPFCMFEGPAANKGKYKFFSTQCDFVALAWQSNRNRPAEHRPRVVMGEFKAIMERSVPWKRVRADETLSQTMSNAALFELQTGVRVDYAMQIYLARRTPPLQTCYASCTGRSAALNSQTGSKVLLTLGVY